MWLGILYYVCGEYEWDGGMCFYGLFIEIEGGKEYFFMIFKVVKEFRKIVLDREWLKSLEYYVRFRYVFYRIFMGLIIFF